MAYNQTCDISNFGPFCTTRTDFWKFEAYNQIYNFKNPLFFKGFFKQ
jgi:hypothetical protein